MSLPWDEVSAYRQVSANPGHFSETRFRLSQLHSAVNNADVLFRGWPFIFVDAQRGRTRVVGSHLETEIDLTELRGHVSFERWELQRSGVFFHKTVMEEAVIPQALKSGLVLDVTMTIYHVCEAVASLWRLYQGLPVPDDEPIDIEFEYTGMLGRKVELVFDILRMPIYPSQACQTESIATIVHRPLADLRAGDASISLSICVELFEQAGWLNPNIEAIEQIATEFLGRAERTN